VRLVLVALVGLAVSVEVDEAVNDQQAGGVQHDRSGQLCFGNGSHPAVADDRIACR
jgi:hypothetical protein